ncbi:MAG: hypothetical protein P4L35_09490 [Ignavibacteriaceae bacterium]|nr:hypothetical protein [Ignavibacteriaceae bacterium]
MKKYLLLSVFILLSISCFAQKITTKNNKTNLKKFESTYIMPGNDYVDEGKLIFKINNGKLIGRGEQTVNPMRALIKLKVTVINLDNSGKGKYKLTEENLDRNGNPLQSSNDKGVIIFQNDGVKIGKTFFKKQ